MEVYRTKLTLIMLLLTHGSFGDQNVTYDLPVPYAICGTAGPPGWEMPSDDLCQPGRTLRKRDPLPDSRMNSTALTGLIRLVGRPGSPGLRLSYKTTWNFPSIYDVDIFGSLGVYSGYHPQCKKDYEISCIIEEAEITILGPQYVEKERINVVSLRLEILCGCRLFPGNWTSFGKREFIEAIFPIDERDEPFPDIPSQDSCAASPKRPHLEGKAFQLLSGQVEWSSRNSTLYPPSSVCPTDSNLLRRKLPTRDLPRHGGSTWSITRDLKIYGATCDNYACRAQYMCYCPGHLRNSQRYPMYRDDYWWRIGKYQDLLPREVGW